MPATSRTDRSLASTPVLFLDCQATGATPAHGHLLELSWSRGRGSDLHSTLVTLPRGARLPPRVSELTGIVTGDLSTARSAAEIWQQMVTGLKATHAFPMPTVIHFARFERPFLTALHREHGDGDPFPLEILCSHEICRRLLPSLPRRGLRAIAGYFGHVMDGPKRAGHHVAATVAVWEAVVPILARRGIETLAALRAFLDRPTPPRPKKLRYPFPRAKRLALPDHPGVYRMLARNGAVLYVGKATSVRERFNSYFRQRWRGDERKLELLTQVVDVRVTRTASALEAALLEADEIKAHAPPYNKALQRREETCWFVNPEDGSSAPRPSDTHSIGPLPDRDALEALWLLRTELRRRSRRPGQGALDWTGRTGSRRLELLGPLWGGPPDDATFDAGLSAALKRAGVQDARLHSAATLLRGGARLHRLHRAEARNTPSEERSATSEEQNAQPETLVLIAPDAAADKDPAWDPQRVQRAVEKSWSRAAHLWRRATWLCRLSEAVIRWRPPGADVERTLVIERGKVTRHDELGSGAELTSPPGHLRSATERQASFERDTYDRLRVLTTELRRLCSEEPELTVTFGPGVIWRRPILSRALSWL